MRVSLEDYLSPIAIKPEDGLEVVAVNNEQELAEVLLDIEERKTDIANHTSILDSLLFTNASLEQLIDISTISVESYPLVKACLANHPKASVLPSMESFTKNPELGSQIAMESVLSFIGDVWDSIIRAIKRLIVAIYDFFKSIITWAKSYFGKSVVQLEKDIDSAGKATHTTVDGKVVDIKTIKIPISESLARHLWISERKDITTDLIGDLERLNTLFISAFINELNYRKGQDFTVLKNIIELSKKFVQPDSNKFGKQDFLHYCDTVNKLTEAEGHIYKAQCIDVYTRNNVDGHYIGNLEVRVEHKGDKDAVVFTRHHVDTDHNYELNAMDNHELQRLKAVLKSIKKGFDQSHNVTDFTNAQDSVLDELAKLTQRITFIKKQGMSGKEGTKRLQYVHGTLQEFVKDIKFRLSIFYNHSGMLIPHLTKLQRLLSAEYINKNVALLNNAAKTH